MDNHQLDKILSKVAETRFLMGKIKDKAAAIDYARKFCGKTTSIVDDLDQGFSDYERRISIGSIRENA